MTNKTVKLDIKNETELGFTKWVPITQEMINQFSQATLDADPMHVDVEWAKQHSPFKKTVAFGFQTIGMLTCFSHEIFSKWAESYPAMKYGLNYGFNKVRLINPVPVDSKIRGSFKLMEQVLREDGGLMLKIAATVEIEGESKPALSAEWLFIVYPQ